MDDVLARLRELQAADLPVHGGRTLAYVYDSGLPDVDRIGREAVAAYAGSNGLDPTSFPSLLAMENDLVGFACDLLDAPDSAVGSVTSGGTESVLLAVQGARDASPSVARRALSLSQISWRPDRGAICLRRSKSRSWARPTDDCGPRRR